MSDVDKGEPKFGGYIIVALITAGIVYSFTAQNKPAEVVPAISSSLPPATAPTESSLPSPQPLPVMTIPPSPRPVHFYESLEGSTYYYGKAVSEEERKSGKRAPDMIAFWYLGRNDQGLDVLQNVTSSSTGGLTTCARPCKVIHQADGTTVGFDTYSIIGAAFADAQHGFLKKHVFPKPKPEPDYPWPEDSAAPAPETPSQ